jgi:hypothetical protein
LKNYSEKEEFYDICKNLVLRNYDSKEFIFKQVN